MKKLTLISLFIFWAFVTSLFTAGFALQEKTNNPTPQNNPAQLIAQGTILTKEELAKHASASSCWLLIDKKIYDVTSYLNQHPGDADTILPTCGTDATRAYSTKGRTTSPSPHSQNAHELLKAYYIGDLGQEAIAVTPTASPTTKPQSNTPATQPTAPSTQPNASVALSIQEIAKHNIAQDCWMIVNNNVYNVTSYLPRHPGGTSAILRYCGKDGGAAFEGLPHSTNAHQLLASFFVGAVGQVANTQTIQQTTSPTVPVGASNNRGDDDEDDD